MKRFRFFVSFITTIISRYLSKISLRELIRSKYVLLLTVALLCAAIAIVFLKYRPSLQTRPTLSEGIIGLYTPTNLPILVTKLLSDSLVSLDQSGTPKPVLAASWDVNKDSTIYTFKLKDGLHWNDGTSIKASELKFNLSDVDVSYPDDKTIQFKLADSFSVFPTLLAQPVFKDGTSLGNGNYNITYEEMSRGLVTKLILTPKDPSLPNLVVRFYPDDKTASTAFNLGEVNSVLGVTDEDTFDSFPKTETKEIVDYTKLVAIFYNTKDPILSDKNLRRALSFAAPKIAGKTLAKTSISPLSWAYNDSVKTYLDDPENAKTALSKVGKGRDSTLTLTTTPSLSLLGNKIIEAWKKVGVNAILRIESGQPQNFQALLTSQDISQDPDQYALWHSTQSDTNLSRYKSDRVDKDLEDGRKIIDLKVRKEKYLDFQKVLLDDSPATFLYFSTFNYSYRSKVGDLLNKVLPLQINLKDK